MSQQYFQKVISFFGEQGLIIQAKANEFYSGNSLSKNDLVICFDVVSSSNSPFINKVSINNYMACTLYFQSQYFPSAIDAFYKFVERNLKENDPITKEKLFSVFNVIEFEHKYHYCKQQDLLFLINYLNKYSDMNKSLLEFILFKLYSAILLCEIKKFKQSIGQSYELIPYLADALERQNDESLNNLYKFIELCNSMLILRNEKEDPECDINEYGSLANSTYNHLKSVNIPLALKVGFNIFEVYLKKGEIQNCLEVCKNMKYALKQQMFQGIKIPNGYYIYLALTSRMAYVYTFLKNYQKVLRSVKHIEDAIKFLNDNDFKNKFVKASYELICVLYKYNIDRNLIKTEKMNSSLETFKRIYTELPNRKLNITPFNMDELYIDTLIVNSSHNWGLLGNNQIDKVYSEIKGNFSRIRNEIIPSLIFGIYNRISGLVENIITDTSLIKQKEYKNKVQTYAKDLVTIVQNYYNIFPIFKTNYSIAAIVKTLYVYITTLFMDQNYAGAIEKLEEFENCPFGKEIISEDKRAKEKLPCIGFISKVYGDIAFKKKKYQEALDHYLDVKLHFDNEETSQRAANNFCIGVCYAFLNKPRKAVNFFETALTQYRNLFDMLKENNEANNKAAERYTDKIVMIENLLKKFQN